MHKKESVSFPKRCENIVEAILNWTQEPNGFKKTGREALCWIIAIVLIFAIVIGFVVAFNLVFFEYVIVGRILGALCGVSFLAWILWPEQEDD